MTSRHLVDPELLPILDSFPNIVLSADTLALARAGSAQGAAVGMANADTSVSLAEHFTPGRDGAPPVRLLVYRPEGLIGPGPVLLHIHGGGYVLGSPEIGDARNRAWCREMGCMAVSVDYRLAPEVSFPGGLEDCYAALEWIAAQGSALGFDSARIVLFGESAGGGIAAGLALLARNRGGPAIRAQFLIYPMLDDRTCTADRPNPVAGEFVWGPVSNMFAWTSWLAAAPGGAEIPYLAAPARAADLSGLPPAFIASGALDLFIDETLDYAARLIRAGVPTEIYVAPGGFHAFDVFAPASTIATRFREVTTSALRRALAR